MNTPAPVQGVISNEPLVPNPNAGLVRVGSYVTCRHSRRRAFVAKVEDDGRVWEPMEPNHPALLRNGGSFPDDHLRYIGLDYEEFEPRYISKARLEALLTPKPERRVEMVVREHTCGQTNLGTDIAMRWEGQEPNSEPITVFTGPNAEANAREILALINR